MLFIHIAYEHLNFIQASHSAQTSGVRLPTVGHTYSQASANTEKKKSLYKDFLEYLITEHISLSNSIWQFVLWVKFVAVDFTYTITLKVMLVELAFTFCEETTRPLRTQRVLIQMHCIQDSCFSVAQ